MEENKLKQAEVLAEKAINKIENKESVIYFFTIDTNGKQLASVANIYEHVKILTELGYNACILHEKDNYFGVESWLGKEYSELPHKSIEKKDLSIGAWDFVVIPEVFANIMEESMKLPCKRIVLCQSHEHILELLNIGKTWGNYGIRDAIVTSNKLGDYVKKLFPSINTHVVPVSIPEYFKDTGKPKKPTVGVHTRNQSETIKLVKSFYLQYPMYKWVSFVDLTGYPRDSFAEAMERNCLNVWVDDISTFGTFPIESMKCGVPVVGKIPNMIPEWMVNGVDENGMIKFSNNSVWANNTMEIPELIAEYLKLWLEDNIPPVIIEEMNKTALLYDRDSQVESIEKIYSEILNKGKVEISERLDELKKRIENNK